MKNYKSDGNFVPYVVAGTAIVSGGARLIGVRTLVATKAGAVGDTVEMLTSGVVDYKKQAALAIAQGVRVYHDAAADEVDTTNTNNFMGFAHVAAAAGDANVQVSLAHAGD